MSCGHIRTLLSSRQKAGDPWRVRYCSLESVHNMILMRLLGYLGGGGKLSVKLWICLALIFHKLIKITMEVRILKVIIRYSKLTDNCLRHRYHHR